MKYNPAQIAPLAFAALAAIQPLCAQTANTPAKSTTADDIVRLSVFEVTTGTNPRGPIQGGQSAGC